MGRQGIKISTEESDKIMQLFDRGMNGSEIATIMKMSKNTVSIHLRSKGVPPKRITGPRAPDILVMSEEVDYSRLPDSILFTPQLFPSFLL